MLVYEHKAKAANMTEEYKNETTYPPRKDIDTQ